MKTRNLGALFDGIVTLLLLSAAEGGLACGGATSSEGTPGNPTTDPTPPSPVFFGGMDAGSSSTGFEDLATFTCASAGAALSDVPRVAALLTPAQPTEYLEVRTQIGFTPSGDAGASPRKLTTLSRAGNACAAASDGAACEQALAEAHLPVGKNGWPRNPVAGGSDGSTVEYEFLVYTRGGVVGVVASPAELATFLGTIDTQEEARLLVRAQGEQLECSRVNADGSFEVITGPQLCSNVLRQRVKVSADGRVEVLRTETSGGTTICGRRFDGLADGFGGASNGLGADFAEVAYLEAASVIAFRRLEQELAEHGAPPALLERVRRARADEIRHASAASKLARRFGGRVRPIALPDEGSRALFDIALENAVEGCVRETYGALVAAYQAHTAEDAAIRALMTEIARDEASHAELAHDVASWLEPRLDARQRELIGEAKARALADLHAGLDAAPAGDVARAAGVPVVAVAKRLLALIPEACWAA